MFSEFRSVFPEISAKKCVHLLLTQPSLSLNDQISLFTAFFLLSKSFLSTSNTEPNSTSTTEPNSTANFSPLSVLDSFLEFTSQEILSSLKAASLQSLLDSIRFISTALQSVSSLLTASEPFDIFQSRVSWLAASWRDESRSDIVSLLQNWAETQVSQLAETASSVVSATDSVSSLASTKREISQLFASIESEWKEMIEKLAQPVLDSLHRLFDSLFQNQSHGLILNCFQSMQTRMQEAVEQVSRSSLAECAELLNATIVSPICTVFSDLTELDYASSYRFGLRFIAERS